MYISLYHTISLKKLFANDFVIMLTFNILIGVVLVLLAGLDSWGLAGAGSDGTSSTPDDDELTVLRWGWINTNNCWIMFSSSDNWCGADVKSTKALPSAIVRFLFLLPLYLTFLPINTSLPPLLLLGGDLGLATFNVSDVAWTICSCWSNMWNLNVRYNHQQSNPNRHPNQRLCLLHWLFE